MMTDDRLAKIEALNEKRILANVVCGVYDDQTTDLRDLLAEVKRMWGMRCRTCALWRESRSGMRGACGDGFGVTEAEWGCRGWKARER